MRALRGRLPGIGSWFVALAVVWVAAGLVHELSHGLAAIALGGRFVWLAVWPGIQLWPHPGQAYAGAWGTSIARTAYALGPGWAHGGWQEGLVWLAGSGTNLVLASVLVAWGLLRYLRAERRVARAGAGASG